ncbi:hypothetical protein [Agromyces silvae]|uniref:hypothetical protein n=1 Tax=Agromyces silvae TaxID=3388266 RepID=UPI00280AC07E|nr:hypothetical protein [Agromyces protaetiae]
MTRSRPRATTLTVSAIAIAVAFGVTLTGCTPTDAPPSASPAVPSASPTPEPVLDPGPVPRIDADCEQLVALPALQSFVGDAGAPLVMLHEPERLTPDEAAVLQLGGLVCDWASHTDPVSSVPSEGAQRVRLRVMPEGLEHAAEYVATYQIADPTYGEHVQGPRCIAPDAGRSSGYCELIGAIGPTWVELQVSGIAAASGSTDASLRDAFRASIADRLVAELQAMTAPRPRWSPTAVGRADSCENALSTEQVAALTGFPDVWFGVSWDGPRLGQYSYATDETGAKRCSIHPIAQADATFGAVFLLPGGSWAFDRYRDTWLASGGMPQPVTGLTPDEAVLRCADEAAECRLDLSLEGDWVAIVFPPVPDESVSDESVSSVSELDLAAARASIVPLAEALVANLGAPA